MAFSPKSDKSIDIIIALRYYLADGKTQTRRERVAGGADFGGVIIINGYYFTRILRTFV